MDFLGLPHRPPFVFVKELVRCEPGQSAECRTRFGPEEPFFAGHFPGNPVMPGVLMLEGMAQTAGTMCIRSLGTQVKPTLVYFLTIDKAKFRKPVGPGDVLEYHMTRLKRRKNMWWFRGEAKVRGEIVAEAELGAMIAEE